jgi:hypothetical protein
MVRGAGLRRAEGIGHRAEVKGKGSREKVKVRGKRS